jgi:hypothetical protein
MDINHGKVGLKFICPDKVPQIAYIERKAIQIEPLRRMLHACQKTFTDGIVWRPLTDLSETDYAAAKIGNLSSSMV